MTALALAGPAWRRPRLAALALLFALPAAQAEFQAPAAPSSFVYDGASLLSAQEQAALSAKLLALDRERGLQIGVAIMPSFEDSSVEDATLAIAERWKPGHAGKNDGVLIALFMKEKKLRIEVGYGLEGAIPDAIASRVIRNVIVPAFRAGQPADGLMQAVDALAAAARGETSAIPRSSKDKLRVPAFVALIVFVMVMSIISRLARGRRTLYGARSSIPWWLLALSARGGGSSRGGGFFGGGGGGGGGWSGGGGSFGGGSFGGGGASGGW